MPSKVDLDYHLNAESICPRQPENAPDVSSEDGITDMILRMLNDRKNEAKIQSWDTLWMCLFPEWRAHIPSSGKLPSNRTKRKL